MTLQELQTKANAKLATFWTQLLDKQTLYWNKRGKFFQLIISPDNPVIDGADTAWTLKHPSDEKFAVDVDFPWTDLIPFQISVDETVGDTVHFSATVTVQLPDGRIFKRTRRATPVIQEATYDNPDPFNQIELTPRTITSFTQEDTGWYLSDPL